MAKYKIMSNPIAKAHIKVANIESETFERITVDILNPSKDPEKNASSVR